MGKRREFGSGFGAIVDGWKTIVRELKLLRIYVVGILWVGKYTRVVMVAILRIHYFK